MNDTLNKQFGALFYKMISCCTTSHNLSNMMASMMSGRRLQRRSLIMNLSPIASRMASFVVENFTVYSFGSVETTSM
ncbi:hypothetical protein Ae201684P_014454 [Aphanomyces euteiches]|uniref:Uncharacterized protein n=1 Tax=Aphanomyces euteiches TaxID=100861 RepID=A0A6G0WRT9_9STRA|nr:hypothetical protein Ae201684_012426 [Aphanomyces euteiches]KAH9090659.1 hypothetical protein Ae201684P_014454 [Aphanomyces euteiches]